MARLTVCSFPSFISDETYKKSSNCNYYNDTQCSSNNSKDYIIYHVSCNKKFIINSLQISTSSVDGWMDEWMDGGWVD